MPILGESGIPSSELDLLYIEYQVYKDASLTILAASGAVNAMVFPLTIEDYVQDRWVRARAHDTLGHGPWSDVHAHVYTSVGVLAFNNTDHVQSVDVPATPTSDPPVPAGWDDVGPDYTKAAYDLYQTNGLNEL